MIDKIQSQVDDMNEYFKPFAELLATPAPSPSETKKRIAAEQNASHWLAEANAAGERGQAKREARCLEKAQYWLDRLNRLEGK